DILASTTTNVGGNTQTVDWNSLFDASGNKKTLPSGFTASTFVKDFSTKANGSFRTPHPSPFTTGSKDTLNISSRWQCHQSNNVNSKTDVMNAYAASYIAANGHQILYFGMERNDNSGDGNIAFWFLQDQAACASNGGTTSFAGDHTDGDLLIVSAFTNGG